ncbi:MAG: hypothetical protein A2W22_04290 [Candidatus Levybacteria bacterium RBG_16_35_11]|nr:MAG: hypothetical protein A2W22_04290 [Candidatus Levybacteria bacterium RBG_16_35_11]
MNSNERENQGFENPVTLFPVSEETAKQIYLENRIGGIDYRKKLVEQLMTQSPALFELVTSIHIKSQGLPLLPDSSIESKLNGAAFCFEIMRKEAERKKLQPPTVTDVTVKMRPRNMVDKIGTTLENLDAAIKGPLDDFIEICGELGDVQEQDFSDFYDSEPYLKELLDKLFGPDKRTDPRFFFVTTYELLKESVRSDSFKKQFSSN